MARPKGSKSRPGGLKPGRKKGSTHILPQYKDEEIRQFKTQILDLFEKGEVENVSQAADKIGVPKIRAYHWLKTDAQWAEDLKLGKEIVADRYEEELLKATSVPMVTARIFMLNGLRPDKYRANYKLVMTNPKVEALLDRLAVAGKQPPEIVEAEVTPVEEVKLIPQLIAETIESKDALTV